MKKFIFLLIVLALCSSVQAELVSQWKLDGDTLDSVGTNHGTAIGGTLTYVPGAPNGADAGGQALDLNGSSQGVSVPHHSSLKPVNMSICTWIKQENHTGTWQNIVRKNDGSTGRYLFEVGSEDPVIDGIWCGFVINGAYRERGASVSPAVLTDGYWHHVATTYDGSYIKIYFDGVEIGSWAFSGSLSTSGSQPVQIGYYSQEWFNGGIDDVRIYNHALSAAEVALLFSCLDPMASSPQPKDRATDSERTLTLSWRPGIFAEKHDVYFGTGYTSVSDANRTNPLGVLVSQNQDANNYLVSGLDWGTTYYWKINEVNSAPDYYIYKGDVWQFTTEPYSYPMTNVTATASSEYSPSRGVENTVNGSGLVGDLHSNTMADMWLSGIEPAGAWVKYEFGRANLSNGSFESPVIGGGWTSRAAFANWVFSTQGSGSWFGGRSIPEGVPAYDGDQLLDMINCVASQHIPIAEGIQQNTTYEFSVYARRYPGQPAGGMELWVSWDNDNTLPVEGGFRTGTLTVTDSWAKYSLTLDTSVQTGAVGRNYLVVEVQSYSQEVLFDNAELVSESVLGGRVYKLDKMWVWNFNDEFNYNFGLKNVNIEYSVDGTDWMPLTGVPQFARADGQTNYAHETEVDFGVAAKHVKLTANSAWGGGNQYGLSEVRFYQIPVRARYPEPASGSTVANVDGVQLRWRAGREAASHDVYFGEDRQAVEDGTAHVGNVPVNNYNTGPLEFGKTYYWMISEVNNAEDPNVWDGPVWSLTTPSYLVVDDMESYGDADVPGQPDSRIWYTWKDGEGWTEPPPGWGGNGTGSVVDLGTDPVHGGGRSLAFRYDNDGTNVLGTSGKAYYSEVRADTADLPIGSNWAGAGIKALTLWFYGDPNNDAGATEQMYLKLNGAKVVYDGDMDHIRQASWHEWNVDLSKFGINLSNVTEIAIGFGIPGGTTPGGSGIVYFEDIRLYPAGCYPSHLKPLADIASASGIGEGNYDCKVDCWDLAVMAADWLKEDYAGIDLRGHWRLDGDATDSSRWGNHGIEVNDVNYVEGKYDQAFEASSGDIYVPDNPSLDPASQITISAWIKPNDLPLDRESHIYRKNAGTTRQLQLLAFWRQGTGGAGPGQVEVSLGLSWADGSYAELNIVTNIADWIDGKWHLVTGTYDGSAMKIYRDGVLLGSPLPHTGRLLDNSGDAYLGNISSGSRYLDGGLDDVRLYGVALTDTQVAQLAAGNEPTGYTRVDSPAELFEGEPQGQRSLDFKDFAILADEWLKADVWP